MVDEYDLQRFVEAQAGVYDRACAELRAGKKRSHWMWFVFPQLRGLGSSEMAIRYGISGMEEAESYLKHSVLGSRLRECAGIVVGLQGEEGGGTTASEIFGYPDDLKFHSSMTLFAKAALAAETLATGGVFQEAVERYFNGRMDKGTLDRLRC
jgi:uncharacterized protein (DUF1810 family)